MGGLTDCLSRVLVEDPQGRALEGPTSSVGHKVSELHVGPFQCLYCLQLDVVLSQDPSRPPPPRCLWTTDTMWDMVTRDAPNVKDCVILGPGLAVLPFSHPQEPREGLYLHEAQELAKEMTKTTTWSGQPAHQQVFPITIVEVWHAISLSCRMRECWD